MTKLETLAAYKAALESAGATEFRFPMSTPDAIELLKEIPEHIGRPGCAEAAAALAEVGPPPTDHESIIKYYQKLQELSVAFWDKFEQTVVDGVEVIRRR